jgi:signal peptidase I
MRADRYKTEASEQVSTAAQVAHEAAAQDAPIQLPDTEAIREAYEKVSYADKLKKSIISTTNILIVVAAVAILVAMLFLPVLRIYGNSMNATLNSGELVVSVKGSSFKTGDIIAFYYNNNILVKRVIANPGDWVDIDLDGNVFVNQQQIDEPYLEEKSFGEPDIDFPYQVPDDRVFVLGDNRDVSIDSRYKSVGCVSSEQIVGKIVFRVWPLTRIGPLH